MPPADSYAISAYHRLDFLSICRMQNRRILISFKVIATFLVFYKKYVKIDAIYIKFY